MQSRGLGTDGLHFDGPANDISISNCTFSTGDDSIALNCPEGYSGDIARVTVTNCTFQSWSLMRLYTTYGSPIRDQIRAVTVSQCTGTLAEAAFLIGLSAGSVPDSVASLTVADCTLTAPAILALAENFGSVELKNVIFSPSRSHAVWNAPVSNRICAFARPSPLYGGGSCVGTSLTFDNCQIVRTSDVAVAAVVLENESVINNLIFQGFAVQDTYPTLPELLVVGNGSVGQLVINKIDTGNIAGVIAPVDFTDVEVVSGTGVLATGWSFPDEVMANGVAYISANSGLPSIKVGGVVQPYIPS